ncbi:MULTISPECIES: amino acid ABC transporter permease [unclassified Meiothermus]|uniref:amino acid ABC transporter permease n=1 Tax=unclassified Meiothermus TaxID=370471 RepID=UPI000D7D2279|nr:MULTISPECIES: amino acid ABC transporter permease [unclassified Meiothermus]PZA08206.1 amino acid ABC transporter permease [Meiothermus sp. Pnk-1]RYM39409.1 amino acid ABC transporter permease [Meiothermus sp. PNK-Is4]
MNTINKQGRNRAPSIPKDATPLALASLVVSVLVIAGAWATLEKLHKVLVQNKLEHPWVMALLALAALLPLLLLFPVGWGLRDASQARAALGRHELIEARVKAAAAREWAWYAIGYAVAAALVFVAIQFLLANDGAVGATFFKLSLIQDSFSLVLQAFWKNVWMFCVAEVFILIWGLVIAVARMVPGRAGSPIRFLATLYTDAFRGLPTIISIYLIALGLPLANVPLVRDWPPEWLAILALTVSYGAYVAEVYRAGPDSIHPSQWAAARSLGLSFSQTLRFVIIPQAVRRIIPPLLNDFIALQKDTALVNVVGVIDGFNQAKIIASNRFNLSAVTTVAILFMLITIPQTRFVDRLLEQEKRRTRA